MTNVARIVKNEIYMGNRDSRRGKTFSGGIVRRKEGVSPEARSIARGRDSCQTRDYMAQGVLEGRWRAKRPAACWMKEGMLDE